MQTSSDNISERPAVPPMVRPRASQSGDVPIKSGALRTLGIKVRGADSFYFLASNDTWLTSRYSRRFPLTEQGWDAAWRAFASEDPQAAGAYLNPEVAASRTTQAAAATAAVTSVATPAPGGAKFLGEAAPLAGIPLSRVFNAACYLITGLALMLIDPGSSGRVWTILLGLAAIGYGAKILLTRSSYWVTTATYIVPVIAVGWALTSLGH